MNQPPQDTQTTESENETILLGEAIGRHLEPSTVIGLSGTLGTGKTKISQGIASGLEIDPETVTSPTFTICIPYSGRLPLLHLDAYRIQSPEEVDELGLDEVVENGAVLLIEWSEKIAALIPPMDLHIQVSQTAERKRKFDFTASSPVGNQLLQNLRTAQDAGKRGN